MILEFFSVVMKFAFLFFFIFVMKLAFQDAALMAQQQVAFYYQDPAYAGLHALGSDPSFASTQGQGQFKVLLALYSERKTSFKFFCFIFPCYKTS